MSEISAKIRPPKPVKVFLGLGANIGKSEDSIRTAFGYISSEVLTKSVLSSLYRTEPQDVKTQPDFINAACSGFFSGSAFELLRKINSIEKNLGRNRSNEQRRGPRLIDIDILLFGDYILNEGCETDGEGRWLRIPHERLNIRRFALIPMLELDSKLRDPLNGAAFSTIAASLHEQGIYTFDKLRYI